MNIDVKLHFMHERGMCFSDIAKKFGISPQEACKSFVKIEELKAKHKPKIVYRKRLNKTGVKYRHQLLVEHMRKL